MSIATVLNSSLSTKQPQSLAREQSHHPFHALYISIATAASKLCATTMCCGRQRPFSRDQLSAESPNENAGVVEDLRGRLADTEARLPPGPGPARARAREAELSRHLEEMKGFVSVMEILETYLKRRFLEQQERVSRLFSSG